jgi:hypothetical protein
MKFLIAFLIFIPSLALADYDYDGTDDGHVIASPNVPAALSLTACAWVRPDSLAAGDETIIAYGNGKDSAQGRGWTLKHTSGGTLAFAGFDGNDQYNEDRTSVLSTSSDTHVCLVIGATIWDGAIYVNGTQSGGTFYTGNIAQSSTDPFSVAKSIPNQGFLRWNGKMAHVAYWTTNLSGAQIGSLADKSTCPADVESASLEIWLPLTDNPATDQSSNAFTVTTESSPSLVSHFSGLPACGASGSTSIIPLLTEVWGY